MRLRLAVALLSVLAAAPLAAHEFAFTDTIVLLKSDGTYQVDLIIDVDALALGVSPSTDSAENMAALEAMSAAELEAACRRIRDERLPEVRTIQAMQRLMPRVLFQRTAASRFLVGRIAPLLARLGLLQLLAGFGAGRFTQGTTKVELSV